MSEYLSIDTSDGVAVLKLSGRFDAKTVEEVKYDVKGVDLSAVALDWWSLYFVECRKRAASSVSSAFRLS